MEFCPRCRGGEVNAPNCPGCGGSGFVDEVEVAPAKILSVSPVVRRQQIETARKAREEEKRRKVRVGSRPATGTEMALAALTPQERRDREKWLRKYQARQARRLKDEARRRKMTPEQLAAEDQRRRERAYVKRLNRLQVAKKAAEAPWSGRGADGQKVPTRPPRDRPSREEQSAKAATNDQLRAQLAALLPDASPDPEHAKADKWPAAKKRTAKHNRRRGQEEGLRELPPIDPLHGYRGEFQTVVPGHERDEDAGRHYGHSFRDQGGQFGSMPQYDDHD